MKRVLLSRPSPQGLLLLGANNTALTRRPLIRPLHAHSRGRFFSATVNVSPGSTIAESPPTDSSFSPPDSASPDSVPADASWQDHLPRWMTINVWSNEDVQSLNGNSQYISSLDKSTRYVLQLLQQLHLSTSRRDSMDRANTARCHYWIEKLDDAARADAILQGMEMFHDTTGEDRMILPKPTVDTYLMVLSLIARDKSVPPQRAQEIVERMEQRFLEQGDLQLRPSAVHWNQVLKSWAISDDDEKSFHAAKLLQRLQKDNLADASSHSHVLRVCALSYATAKGRKLGSSIAVSVYNEARAKELNHQPHLYSLFIKAASYIENDEKRDEQINLGFSDCRNAGLVNQNVLHEFLKGASDKLVKKHLGNIPQGNNIKRILHHVPKDDKRNVKRK